MAIPPGGPGGPGAPFLPGGPGGPGGPRGPGTKQQGGGVEIGSAGRVIRTFDPLGAAIKLGGVGSSQEQTSDLISVGFCSSFTDRLVGFSKDTSTL